MQQDLTWLDRIIAEQKVIQGEELTKLVSDVARDVELYGDEFFDP
jgi:hypothetical protein